MSAEPRTTLKALVSMDMHIYYDNFLTDDTARGSFSKSLKGTSAGFGSKPLISYQGFKATGGKGPGGGHNHY